MPDVRIAYPRETPNPWKGALLVSADLFQSAPVTLSGAIYTPILSVSDVEFRERRLILGVSPSIYVPNDAPLASPYPRGAALGSYVGTSDLLEIYGSINLCFNVGLRITCTGYAESVLLCDARPGVYRIPPCTAIRVEAVTTLVNALGFEHIPLYLRAELSDSCAGPVIRPTETAVISLDPPDNYTEIYLNQHARWLDFRCTSVVQIGSATCPVLVGAVAAGPTIVRNYATQAWFPSGDPVDIGGMVGIGNPPSVTISNIGTAGGPTAEMTAVQYLEW